ncbi:MAG: PocR ligand-binding domain-containing protein [Paenibacillaceae bacterium]|nr:PocR ligand-binding domain-containing protein [Paenibacillaceae bacterium]
MEEKLVKEWADELFSRSRSGDGANDMRHLFDSGLFARLQRTFMIATGLNGNILDRNGVSITEEMIERSPSFCRLVQSVPEGQRRCNRSDQRVTSQSIAEQKTVVCRCHAGLYDSAAPIRYKQLGMGAFITGQVLLEPPTETMVDEIVRRVSDLGLDREQLVQTIREIPQMTEEKLKATTELMQILADYIAKSLEEAESSRREAEWRSLLRETEMKVIQSKLHPHFLFNILNLISGQALLENATNTYTTVNHLSKMLRYIIKSYRPLVTLDEELEHLDSYVLLQVLRFEDRLRFHVEVADDALRQALLPSLTVQILIENAIKHGVEPKEGECAVHVRIDRCGSDMLTIEIADNGVGMDAGKLRQLNGGEGEFADGLSGIGMIRKRLDYYFSGNFAFHIDSKPGSGTTVTLSMPVMTSR